MVLVAGRAESLLELRAPTPFDMVRLAWHLGNRHTDLQIDGDRIFIRHDHVLEDMAGRLGAMVTPVEAPFDPESGASAHDEQHHGS
jgi:urease accessory protein